MEEVKESDEAVAVHRRVEEAEGEWREKERGLRLHLSDEQRRAEMLKERRDDLEAECVRLRKELDRARDDLSQRRREREDERQRREKERLEDDARRERQRREVEEVKRRNHQLRERVEDLQREVQDAQEELQRAKAELEVERRMAQHSAKLRRHHPPTKRRSHRTRGRGEEEEDDVALEQLVDGLTQLSTTQAALHSRLKESSLPAPRPSIHVATNDRRAQATAGRGAVVRVATLSSTTTDESSVEADVDLSCCDRPGRSSTHRAIGGFTASAPSPTILNALSQAAQAVLR